MSLVAGPPTESCSPDDAEGSGPAPIEPIEDVSQPGTDRALTAPGVIRQVAACGATIDLLGRTSQLELNGEVAISSVDGADWHGNAGYDTEDRPMLGPLLTSSEQRRFGATSIRASVFMWDLETDGS